MKWPHLLVVRPSASDPNPYFDKLNNPLQGRGALAFGTQEFGEWTEMVLRAKVGLDI